MNQSNVRAERMAGCLDVITAVMKVHDAAPSPTMAEATLAIIRASMNVDASGQEVAR